MVKNRPSNAGDAGSIPGQGTKISHAAGQLRWRVETTDPALSGSLTARAQTTATREAREPQLEKPVHRNEEPACCNERSCMLQRRSCVRQLRPDAAKKIN